MTKLTKAEAAWIKRVQAVLDECPSDRIGAFTIGDPVVTLYNRDKDEQINAHIETDFGRAVEREKAELGVLRFPFPIHSTCG